MLFCQGSPIARRQEPVVGCTRIRPGGSAVTFPQPQPVRRTLAHRSNVGAPVRIDSRYGTGFRCNFAAALSRNRRRFSDIDLSKTAENRG